MLGAERIFMFLKAEKKKKKGFTLLELLIVIVIIAILAGIAIPGWFGVVRRTRIAQARHNLNLIAQAQKMCWTETRQFASFFDDRPSQAACGPERLGNFIEELFSVDNDPDWVYSGWLSFGGDGFLIRAISSDPSDGCYIWLDDRGMFTEWNC